MSTKKIFLTAQIVLISLSIVLLLTAMKGALNFAIKNKKLVSLDYMDAFCIVEPYLTGMHRNGQQVLYCYQIGGEYAAVEEGWKLLYLYAIHNIVILPERLDQVRKEYHLLKEDLKTVYCEIPA